MPQPPWAKQRPDQTHLYQLTWPSGRRTHYLDLGSALERMIRSTTPTTLTVVARDTARRPATGRQP